MALNKDVLGAALFAKRNAFCNKTRTELLALYGDDDGIRLAACKEDAEAIIDHIKAAGVVPALGLIAPNGGGPVTGQTTIT